MSEKHQLDTMQKRLSALANPDGPIVESKTFHFNNDKKPGSIKRVKDPITLSIKILASIIDFWTDMKNQPLLSKKDVLDQKIGDASVKAARKKILSDTIYNKFKRLENVEPVFCLPEKG